MTLILTQISKHGIVHASDSNITAGGNTPAGESQKLFKIEYLNAGLTIAGSYSVGGIRMNSWMNDFIQEQANAGASLGDFARTLGNRLETQMSSKEKNNGSMVHIAAYVEEEDRSHPEFWFVRNVTGINIETGEYTGISSDFYVSEDFWTRDCPEYKIMEAFSVGNSQMTYINGYASGRIGFVVLQKTMGSFLKDIWSNHSWAFRPPCSIEEDEMLVKLQMQIIGMLFKLSDYPAPYIGGSVQLYVIPKPSNAVTESPLPTQ